MMTAPIFPALTEHHIRVLLVDDQRLVGETIRRMLAGLPDVEYLFCADPAAALTQAETFRPTVILQDLIMPGADGIEMVRAFRMQQSTSATPIIVLSSKEEATTKAEAFNAGANDYLVKLPDKLEVLARIRYHSLAYIHRLQRDEAFTVLEAQQRIITQELADAAAYVRSLLPEPMALGDTVRSEWIFLPSTSLGGDSFGYHWLAPDRLAMYLLDVCGHGVGSALLSVSALNTIRNRTLPNTDFHVPSQVLAGLNHAFPMAEQNGKYFTLWYGIFNPVTRELTHAGGGHPPAIAIAPDASIVQLGSTGPMIGAFPDVPFGDEVTVLPPGTKLFVFSDGCYEIWNPEEVMMTVPQFSQQLVAAAQEPDPLDRIVAASRAWQNGPDFEDDFSLVLFHL
jgi:sigma-B regulation protein RsbU (phosphoserine phosphatase)